MCEKKSGIGYQLLYKCTYKKRSGGKWEVVSPPLTSDNVTGEYEGGALVVTGDDLPRHHALFVQYDRLHRGN
jgi:hypothetical protein